MTEPQNFKRRLEEQRSLVFESTHRNRDGQVYPVEIRSNYIEYGGQAYNCAFVQDISERKKTEALLRAKTEELHQLFSVTPDLFCIVKEDGAILRFNPQREKVPGSSLDELKQKSLLDYAGNDDLPAPLKSFQPARHERVIDFVNRYRCKDGSLRWLEWRFPHPPAISSMRLSVTSPAAAGPNRPRRPMTVGAPVPMLRSCGGVFAKQRVPQPKIPMEV